LKGNRVRKYPRISLAFPVEYTTGSETHQVRALTLGGGGLFLTIPDSLPPGTEVHLRFRPAKHLPFMEVKARVCYHEAGHGGAVEFTEIDPENRDKLLRLIHRKKGELRQSPRAPLATQVQCQECMSLAFSRDISVGGLFIETKQPLPIGSSVSLRFHLDDPSAVIVASAEVTYHVANFGMGVQFVEISPEDRKRIKAFVARAVSAPEQPERQAPRDN